MKIKYPKYYLLDCKKLGWGSKKLEVVIAEKPESDGISRVYPIFNGHISRVANWYEETILKWKDDGKCKEISIEEVALIL